VRTTYRRIGHVTSYRVVPAAQEIESMEFRSMSRRDEFGFAMCRLPSGKLVRGPVATGNPRTVQIPVQCPPGSQLVGLFHTHPGGIAFPSHTDVQSGIRVGARSLCIDADGDLRCFTIRRGRR